MGGGRHTFSATVKNESTALLPSHTSIHIFLDYARREEVILANILRNKFIFFYQKCLFAYNNLQKGGVVTEYFARI